MTIETTTYARVWEDEALGWLSMLEYWLTVQETEGLWRETWDYLPDIEDVGTIATYIVEHQIHPFLRFIFLDVQP